MVLGTEVSRQLWQAGIVRLVRLRPSLSAVPPTRSTRGQHHRAAKALHLYFRKSVLARMVLVHRSRIAADHLWKTFRSAICDGSRTLRRRRLGDADKCASVL